MDKFIVRFSAISVNLYISTVLVYAYNGIDISNYDYIFSSSILLGLVLTILSHTQGKYHCKWIRALCYNSTITPTISFIDSQYTLFEDAMVYIYLIATLWSISVLITLFLAIRHFIKVQKLKSNKRRLYEDRRRNERERLINFLFH